MNYISLGKRSEMFLNISDELAVLILAFNGGLYDVAGYLLLQQLFTSSITGNVVVACASAFTVNGTICRACVTASFFLSAGIGGGISLISKTKYSCNTRLSSSLVFFMYLVFLVVVLILGLLIDDKILLASENQDQDNPYVVLVGSLMGAAMGFHNAAAKDAIQNCPPTTVMTSTLVNVATNATNTLVYVVAGDDKLADSRGKLVTTSRPLVSFIAGALVGAAVTHYGRFYFGIIPIFNCLFLLLQVLAKETEQKRVAVKGDDVGIEAI